MAQGSNKNSAKRGKHLIGVYPGTFDPITKGHSDLILRAAKVVDKLIIGVADNSRKSPIFTHECKIRPGHRNRFPDGLGKMAICVIVFYQRDMLNGCRN